MYIVCVLKLLILLHMTHAWVCFGPECAHASLNFVSLPWYMVGAAVQGSDPCLLNSISWSRVPCSAA